jgi:hypothetical protein
MRLLTVPAFAAIIHATSIKEYSAPSVSEPPTIQQILA